MQLRKYSLVLALILTCLLSEPVYARETYSVPSNSSFKSYMDYGTITDRSSKQYKIQTLCETDDNGLRRYKGYYTVAVGSGFGATVGDYIDVNLSSDVTLHCVIGDMKKDEHTDAKNIQVSHNGNVVEFIVDAGILNSEARGSGDISDINGFEGYVKSVDVIGPANIDVTEQSVQTITPNRSNYLIMSKCSIPTPDGNTLYSVEYAFGADFNSIVCSQEFYDSISVGDVVDYLE
ncbi:MAG: hypothetical protein NC489_30185 [Ruminococcus flavefaciens]|nr:hypothetical protein [Ruminococcus flavefaciens]